MSFDPVAHAIAHARRLDDSPLPPGPVLRGADESIEPRDPVAYAIAHARVVAPADDLLPCNCQHACRIGMLREQGGNDHFHDRKAVLNIDRGGIWHQGHLYLKACIMRIAHRLRKPSSDLASGKVAPVAGVATPATGGAAVSTAVAPTIPSTTRQAEGFASAHGGE